MAKNTASRTQVVRALTKLVVIMVVVRGVKKTGNTKCVTSIRNNRKVGEMMDRKKVIHAVETAFDVWIDEYTGCSWFKEDEVRQAKEDAITMLKEQDAKNVVDMRLSKDWFRIASCPRCNELLNWVYHRKNCGYCGQAVKWE